MKMKKIESLQVRFHNKKVGTLTLTADKKCCVFEYDSQWLTEGFSISPLELPLKPGLLLSQILSMATLAYSKTVCLMAMAAIFFTRRY